MSEKARLRNEALNIRGSFSTEKINEVSREIMRNFLNLEIVEKSRKFLLYHSFGKEIITHDLINQLQERGKEVYLPYVIKEEKILGIGKYSKDELASGVFGIKEPARKENIPVNLMDIILVPGLLFAKDGYRLGYGGGYYDRLLKNVEERVITIGFCFDEFLRDSLPFEEFDVPVKMIITEKRVLSTGGGKD